MGTLQVWKDGEPYYLDFTPDLVPGLVPGYELRLATGEVKMSRKWYQIKDEDKDTRQYFEVMYFLTEDQDLYAVLLTYEQDIPKEYHQPILIASYVLDLERNIFNTSDGGFHIAEVQLNRWKVKTLTPPPGKIIVKLRISSGLVFLCDDGSFYINSSFSGSPQGFVRDPSVGFGKLRYDGEVIDFDMDGDDIFFIDQDKNLRILTRGYDATVIQAGVKAIRRYSDHISDLTRPETPRRIDIVILSEDGTLGIASKNISWLNYGNGFTFDRPRIPRKSARN